MKKAIETGLAPLGSPMEWATLAGGVLYSAHVPILPDGTFETGAAEAQVTRTLDNLKQAVEAAGGTLADVAQVLVYLTAAEHAPALNQVWPRYFAQPYPNRATVVVSALLIPGIVIEIVAHANIGA